MAVNHFDLIVIGSGPAGERGAAHAASLGKRVALVEREANLGGTVSNLGTLPSKTLREAAVYLSGFRQRGFHGLNLAVQEQLGAPDLLHRERLVRQLEQARLRAVVDQGRIDVYHGRAVFVDPHTVRVKAHGGAAQDELLSADKILIATGSSPWRAPQFCVDHPAVIDSEGILRMARLPGQLTIVGGGVIAAEYASIFSALGVKVSLMDEGERLLPYLDADISRALLAALQAQGVEIRMGELVEGLVTEPSLALRLRSGEVLPAELVLVCTGRQGNTQDLELAAAGLEADARGFLSVDEHGQTQATGIYAAGDVRGFPSLASAAREQAVTAMRHAFGGTEGGAGSGFPLYGIYTIPECALAGETEEALIARGVPVVVGVAHYAANVRGQIIGARNGFLKLVFHKDTQHLLGVHIIGEQASELVHVGAAALQARAKARFLSDASYNYPTLAELYRTAALDAMAKAKPVVKPSGPRLPGLHPAGK